jgi:nucleoside-diphosphate-sugar epimerase
MRVFLAGTIERGAPGIYNVTDDEPAPQPQWLPVLVQALGAEPPAAAETPPPPYSLEMSLRAAANAKAKRKLGWQPRYPSWREGFAASLA